MKKVILVVILKVLLNVSLHSSPNRTSDLGHARG